jgi:hypothetical protein
MSMVYNQDIITVSKPWVPLCCTCSEMLHRMWGYSGIYTT